MFAAMGSVARAQSDAPGHNWSGFYIGANLAAAGFDEERNLWNSSFWAPGAGGTGRATLHSSDWLWGGHVGYNLTFGRWLVGIDASMQSAIAGEATSPFFTTDRWRTEVGSLTTVTGRLGYAFDRWMLYAKGGYAGAEVSSTVYDATNVIPGFCGPNQPQGHCRAGTNGKWHAGWTVGGGVEFALARHVTVGLEYSYMDLGPTTFSNVTSVSAGTVAYSASSDVNISTIGVRLSYKLNEAR